MKQFRCDVFESCVICVSRKREKRRKERPKGSLSLLFRSFSLFLSLSLSLCSASLSLYYLSLSLSLSLSVWLSVSLSVCFSKWPNPIVFFVVYLHSISFFLFAVCSLGRHFRSDANSLPPRTQLFWIQEMGHRWKERACSSGHLSHFSRTKKKKRQQQQRMLCFYILIGVNLNETPRSGGLHPNA